MSTRGTMDPSIALNRRMVSRIKRMVNDKRVLKAILHRLSKRYWESEENPFNDLKRPQEFMEDEFLKIFEIAAMVVGYSKFNVSCYNTFKIIEYLVKNGIPGDIVECGVFRGIQCLIAALTLQHFSDTGRTIWLFDTFQGMPEPAEIDMDLNKHRVAKEFWKKQHKEDSYSWVFCPIDVVKKNMAETNYDPGRVKFVQGKVEDTLRNTAPAQIAFLRLDTCFYSSTVAELEALYPKVSPGGILNVDGYGKWTGAKLATDEFFARPGRFPLLLRCGFDEWITVKNG